MDPGSRGAVRARTMRSFLLCVLNEISWWGKEGSSVISFILGEELSATPWRGLRPGTKTDREGRLFAEMVFVLIRPCPRIVISNVPAVVTWSFAPSGNGPRRRLLISDSVQIVFRYFHDFLMRSGRTLSRYSVTHRVFSPVFVTGNEFFIIISKRTTDKGKLWKFNLRRKKNFSFFANLPLTWYLKRWLYYYETFNEKTTRCRARLSSLVCLALRPGYLYIREIKTCYSRCTTYVRGRYFGTRHKIDKI